MCDHVVHDVAISWAPGDPHHLSYRWSRTPCTGRLHDGIHRNHGADENFLAGPLDHVEQWW